MAAGRFREARDLLLQQSPGVYRDGIAEMLYRLWGYEEDLTIGEMMADGT